jgi:F-type H+-transporting ATPase subunit a
VANDPIHQFQISKLIPIEIGGMDLSFTNSSLFMVAHRRRGRRLPVS